MSKTERFKRLQDSRDADTSNPSKPEVIEKIIGDFETPTKLENSNTAQEYTAVSVVRNNKTEQTSLPLTRKTTHEHSNVSLTRNSNTEQLSVTETPRSPSKSRIPPAIEEFEKRLNKPTIEETHTRATWLIRNDLLSRLNKLARHQQRGFKTYVVNYALESILDELENK